MNDEERPQALPETAPTTKLVSGKVTTWRLLRAGQKVNRLERRVWAIEERLDALEVKP